MSAVPVKPQAPVNRNPRRPIGSKNLFRPQLRAASLFLIVIGVLLAPLAFVYLRPSPNFPDPPAARIVVFHVPMAWLACLSFVVSAVYAARYLLRRELGEDDASAAAAELGLLCCILATVTGSIFARTQWGSWWNWDPRESSIFFLLLIYGAYFALRGVVEEPYQRGRFASVYALMACIAMPFLVFVVPRVFFSLHPEKAHMAGSYWLVLALSFFGFLAFLYQVFRVRCAVGRRRLEGLSADTGEILDATLVRPERAPRIDVSRERIRP